MRLLGDLTAGCQWGEAERRVSCAKIELDSFPARLLDECDGVVQAGVGQ